MPMKPEATVAPRMIPDRRCIICNQTETDSHRRNGAYKVWSSIAGNNLFGICHDCHHHVCDAVLDCYLAGLHRSPALAEIAHRVTTYASCYRALGNAERMRQIVREGGFGQRPLLQDIIQKCVEDLSDPSVATSPEVIVSRAINQALEIAGDPPVVEAACGR